MLFSRPSPPPPPLSLVGYSEQHKAALIVVWSKEPSTLSPDGPSRERSFCTVLRQPAIFLYRWAERFWSAEWTLNRPEWVDRWMHHSLSRLVKGPHCARVALKPHYVHLQLLDTHLRVVSFLHASRVMSFSVAFKIIVLKLHFIVRTGNVVILSLLKSIVTHGFYHLLDINADFILLSIGKSIHRLD